MGRGGGGDPISPIGFAAPGGRTTLGRACAWVCGCVYVCECVYDCVCVCVYVCEYECVRAGQSHITKKPRWLAGQTQCVALVKAPFFLLFFVP